MILLDLERLRHSEGHIHMMPEYSDAWDGPLRWRICSECLWLTLTYDPYIVCGRPEGEPIRYGGGSRSIANPTCHPEPLKYVPQELADALSAAYRLGGVNAVVAMINIPPERFGLPSSLDKYIERFPKKHHGDQDKR